MNRFSVLDRNQKINQNCFLQASAGTGKTFSIEHLVVRLLLKGKPLEKILVVTFTRAATKDLKERIRSNIENAIVFLKNLSKNAPDYLLEVMENGGEQNAISCLKRALRNYDQAQIFTIHSFCARMLRIHILESSLSLNSDDPPTDCQYELQLQRIIKDFFRTGLKDHLFTREQLRIAFKQDVASKLIKILVQKIEIKPPKPLSLYLEEFYRLMANLKWKEKQILDTFNDLLPQYKKYTHDLTDKVKQFAALFNKEHWNEDDLDLLLEDGIALLDALDPSNLKAKFKENYGHFTLLKDQLNELSALIDEARNPEKIIELMAFHCQKLALRAFEEEEYLSSNDLLIKMKQALNQHRFIQSIRNLYEAAVIDEFQDTDPIQWEIFDRLFVSDPTWGTVFLVGDPKQSIYGFRQADIYTYKKAETCFTIAQQAYLDTNFRSEPALVDALNLLFSQAPIFSLPKTDENIPYIKVKAASKQAFNFDDDRKSIHFFASQSDENFLPFVIQEIQNLKNLSYNRIAILVRDTHQCIETVQTLRGHNIPVVAQKPSTLVGTPAFKSFQDLLIAIQNKNHLSVVLGGPIFNWNHRKLLDSENFEQKKMLLEKWQNLCDLYEQNQLSGYIQGLLSSQWNDSKTLLEEILGRDNGEDFLNDFFQIYEYLLQYEMQESATCQMLLNHLDKLTTNQDGQLQKRLYTDLDGVQVLTMHSSKGLEFDIVFALGVARRTPPPSNFILSDSCQKYYPSNSKEYIDQCKEVDAEKMRQLYVAMTRAKLRLYLPFVIDAEQPLPGTASPMELFATHFDSFLEFITNAKDHISVSKLEEKTSIQLKITKKTETNLAQPKLTVEVPKTYFSFNSFTTLSSGQHTNVGAPQDFSNPIKTPQTLPAGKETGILLHKILEKIDLSKVDNIHEMIQPFIQNTPYSEWHETITTMIYNALTSKIGNTRICDISCCYREIEFLYPDKNQYLKGVIDLIFSHEGKYYLVDWKSNWLESYEPENLKKCMQENQYDLQAKIYMEAMKRYLALVDKKPFDEIFGGIYFIFLRDLRGIKGALPL